MEDSAQQEEQAYDETKRWYVINAYTNFENKVAEAVEREAARLGLTDQVGQVVVPTQKVTEVRRGQRVEGTRKFFPGYVLAQLDMDDALWHMIKGIPKVTGFLGGGGQKPIPISNAEAERILGQMAGAAEAGAKPVLLYQVGEEVAIIDGPFASMTGVVEEVDEDKGRLKVSVSIFGRATPVDLEYTQVEKA
ncbi:MAG TPA: transcription termination/antitermination protein NusG [Rhodospirillaceae bacterium]|jgi:transcriptional antiterminator NusG|nr:transcription termination/antitermination protein NusG [Alphaproteobacteria bacterium]HBH26402.1 transcription termination/antitermination protein NusG [Rhodospirillaceae bacterium]